MLELLQQWWNRLVSWNVRGRLRTWWRELLSSEHTQRYLTPHILPLSGVILALGIWFALSLQLPSDTGLLEEGKPSPISIRAPRSAEFASEVRTAAARAQAENQPENLVYTTDFLLPTEQRATLDSLLNTITSIRNDPTLEEEEQVEQMIELSSASVVLSGTLANAIVSLTPAEWEQVNKQTITLYDRAISENSFELTKETVKRLRERTLPYWTGRLPQPQKDIVFYLTSSFLRVNRILDEEATRLKKQEARETIEAVKVKVQAGESIVRAGDFVSPEVIEKARATGALPKQLSWIAVAGKGMLSILLSFVFLLYMVAMQKEIVRQPRPLMVITITIVLTALVARFLQPLWEAQPYAFPLAATILMLTVIFNSSVALSAAVLLSIIVGVLAGNSLATAATMLLGSVIAIFSVRGAERSLTFLVGGLAIAATTLLAQLSFCFVESGRLCQDTIPTILLFSGTNGSLSAILSLGLFSLVGHVAGVVTPLKLMELAHPSQPMLRKIIQEAPGTYYHSVAVANLAEAAANAVGADALLLRVAAYYHDIGKTLRPFFFTDNQIGRENVHNDLDPKTSADIIIDHVREGLKMAKAAGLPQQIIDFIPTHHGTHLVGHFYQLALRQEDSVNIEDFRYPGPKPWTREQGILMLSDSVEATVRAKAQHSKLVSSRAKEEGQIGAGEQTIEDLVGSIIDERLRSGQLDNTSLTLRDLVLIRQTFVTSLQSIYHPRTEYVRQRVRG